MKEAEQALPKGEGGADPHAALGEYTEGEGAYASDKDRASGI